jgi:anti-anti-sigma factor
VTELRIEREERDGAVVLRLRGEIDLANAARVGEDVRREVDNTTFALALDLRGLTYLDSAGVGLLFDLAARLRSRRQELVVVPADGTLPAQVIALVALDSVAIVASDVEEGLGRVRIAPRDEDPPFHPGRAPH